MTESWAGSGNKATFPPLIFCSFAVKMEGRELKYFIIQEPLGIQMRNWTSTCTTSKNTFMSRFQPLLKLASFPVTESWAGPGNEPSIKLLIWRFLSKSSLVKIMIFQTPLQLLFIQSHTLKHWTNNVIILESMYTCIYVCSYRHMYICILPSVM